MTTSIYYTYRSFEEFEGGRSYIGYRKCPAGKTPESDQYLGSYTDKTFAPTAKEILGVYCSQEEAVQAEVDLHKMFNVAKNPQFANRAVQTSTKFCYHAAGENHYLYGKSPDEETKRKISETLKNKFKVGNHPLCGRSLTEEHKQKLSELNKGKKLREETKRKMSKSRKGKVVSEETRRKISKAHRGRVFKEDHRKNLSKARLKLNLIGKKSCHYKPRDWYHPTHGKIFNKSLTDLVGMFPDQKLLKGCLSRVANGKQSNHKGWNIVWGN